MEKTIVTPNAFRIFEKTDLVIERDEFCAMVERLNTDLEAVSEHECGYATLQS